MFGTRFIALIIALLLATHVIAPSDGWFIALAVLIGLSMLKSFFFWPVALTRWAFRWSRGRDWSWRTGRTRWADEWWS